MDAVKLDRSLTAALTSDPTALAVVRAVLHLAGDLGLEVVAEGVETTAQRELLVELGCRTAQGFLWSPPVPAEDLLRCPLLRGA